MNLTNRQLWERLNKLTLEQLDMSATVAIDGEFFGICDICLSDKGEMEDQAADVLDPGTPVLIVT